MCPVTESLSHHHVTNCNRISLDILQNQCFSRPARAVYCPFSLASAALPSSIQCEQRTATQQGKRTRSWSASEPAAVNPLLTHKIRLFCNDVVSASSVIYDLNLIPHFGSLLLFDSFIHRGLFDLVFYPKIQPDSNLTSPLSSDSLHPHPAGTPDALSLVPRACCFPPSGGQNVDAAFMIVIPCPCVSCFTDKFVLKATRLHLRCLG